MSKPLKNLPYNLLCNKPQSNVVELIRKRVCSICRVEKDLTINNFYTSSSRPCGYRYDCRTCEKVRRDNRAAKDKKQEFDVVMQNGKFCSTCQITKSAINFGRNTHTADGFHGRCKSCQHEYARTAPRKKINHETVRKHVLWSSYRIRPQDYTRLLSEQGFACAVCKKPHAEEKHKKLVVDHCHKSGKVRGLLCSKCNSGLGYFEDSAIAFRNAAAYLEKSSHHGS